MIPSELPEAFRKQIETLFEDASLEVNHWLFWAEKAQSHTHHASGEELVAWYRNAMLIYDFLEKREQGSFISRIYMRLGIIKAYGYDHKLSRPYLEEIMDWVLQELPADAAPITAESMQWMKLPPERIRELRALKQKLKIAQHLEEQGLALPEHVRALMPLMAVLP
jgi:hypothetical protein